MQTVIVINKDQMGDGDAALGRKILGTCLRKLANSESLEAIVLYNAGVKLAVRGSPVVTELRLLHEAGVDILPCGTCVEHYGLRERLAFDHSSNMDEILAALEKAEKVITL